MAGLVQWCMMNWLVPLFGDAADLGTWTELAKASPAAVAVIAVVVLFLRHIQSVDKEHREQRTQDTKVFAEALQAERKLSKDMRDDDRQQSRALAESGYNALDELRARIAELPAGLDKIGGRLTVAPSEVMEQVKELKREIAELRRLSSENQGAGKT